MTGHSAAGEVVFDGGDSDFVDKSPLDIRTTTNVGDNGVIPPSTNLETAEVSFSIDQIKGETYFVGSDDHFGLQFTRSDDTIQVFPRLCPHRGCSLDGAPRSNGVVSCPWHGRTFPALCSISISEGQACFNGEMHQLTFDGNRLSVKFKAQQLKGTVPIMPVIDAIGRKSGFVQSLCFKHRTDGFFRSIAKS